NGSPMVAPSGPAGSWAVGGRLATVTVAVACRVPPAESVAVSVTWYVPLSRYRCWGEREPVVVVPSPKSHAYVQARPAKPWPWNVTVSPSLDDWFGPADRLGGLACPTICRPLSLNP